MSQAGGSREGQEAGEGGLLDRSLRLFSDVKNGEGANAVILLLTIFVLLFCYYILKTVREPLVLVSAARDLSLIHQAGLPEWFADIVHETRGPQIKAVAAALQALLLIVYVPAYSWVASKLSRIGLIVGVTTFFVVCIELFFVLRLLDVPMLGFFFYIWLGIFSVSMIAQFWSFGNDIYSEDQGKRLFPIIGVGATAGSPLGSKVADLLSGYLRPDSDATLDGFQTWIQRSELDPAFILIQLPAILLVVFLGLMVWVARRTREPNADEPEAPGGEPSEEERAPKDRASAEPTVSRGFSLILRSPYLRLIAAVILVLNLVNTMGEFILSDLVVSEAVRLLEAGEIEDVGTWITSFYGDFFFWVNIAALLLQAFVVSRIVKYIGIKGVLLALPIVALGSYALFSLGLGLVLLRWAKTAENATDYSIMNTGKALVWLPTSRSAKYQAKQAVDTLLVRFGDVISAGMFLVGTLALSLGMQTLALVNLGLVVVWLGLTFLLVRRHAAVEADPKSDPVATG